MSSALAYHDSFILECCLQQNREPYIGVDNVCSKDAIFCIQHSPHVNSEGLTHQMMPLRQFKRKIDQKKFMMQSKVSTLIDTLSKFIDDLISQIRQIKLRKCIQLSMLWLRDLAQSQYQYQLMKKVYRMEFGGVSCNQIHSIYYKIIHNKTLQQNQVSKIRCYEGLSHALTELSDRKNSVKILSQKLTQIEGVLTDGQILKKVLPDFKQSNSMLNQVLLQEPKCSTNFKIEYNKSRVLRSTPNYVPFFTKYKAAFHVTYHISVTTKHSNIMLGVCANDLKQNTINNAQSKIQNLHYDSSVALYNCANGNTYKDGIFFTGSNLAIKGINKLQIKIRLSHEEVFISTNKNILMRAPLPSIKNKKSKNEESVEQMYLLFLARTEGDAFEIYSDNGVSADNLIMQGLISQQGQNKIRSRNMHNNPITKFKSNQGQIVEHQQILLQDANQIREHNGIQAQRPPSISVQSESAINNYQGFNYPAAKRDKKSYRLDSELMMGINEIAQQESQMQTTMKLNQTPLSPLKNKYNNYTNVDHSDNQVTQSQKADLINIRKNKNNFNQDKIRNSDFYKSDPSQQQKQYGKPAFPAKQLKEIQNKANSNRINEEACIATGHDWNNTKQQYLKDLKSKIQSIRQKKSARGQEFCKNMNDQSKISNQRHLKQIPNISTSIVNKRKSNDSDHQRQQTQKLGLGPSLEHMVQSKTAQNNSKNMLKLKTEPSNNNQRMKTIRSGSASNKQSESSKVKINLSDQGMSQFNSIIKLSLMSGVRRGSDQINTQDIKLKQKAMMAESMQPQPASNIDQIKKIKTPPKMKSIDKKFSINQSFQM